jgi:hypothetical protein
VAKRLTTDWRLWAGLALAVLIALAGVIASEYPRVAAIRKLRRTGWVIHRDSMPLGGGLNFPPRLLLRVESRLPEFLLSDGRTDWEHEWFVHVIDAEIANYSIQKHDPPTLRELEPLRELRALRVRGVRTGLTDFDRVANLRSLEAVELRLGHRVSMTEVTPLQALPHLKQVLLQAPDFDDEALDALSEMTHLEELTIYSPGVTQRLSPAITVLQSQKHVTLRVGDDQQ